MKLQRLIAILTTLLQNERQSATTLAEKFEVSVRTIYRDMQTLEQAGIPIVTHTGLNGGFGILPSYKIGKELFTNSDISTLLTSLYSVSGPLQTAQVNQTLEKIKALIPKEYGKAIELTSKQLYIDMTPWATNPLVTEALEITQQALAQSCLLRFTYSARYGSIAARTVEPHQLVLKENNWYLRAFCHQRQEFRTFKLARIRDVKLLDETFVPREFASGLEDFKDWYNDNIIYVDLVAEEGLRTRVLDFCREEYITDLPNGKIAVHMPFVESAMGYGVIMGLGHGCEVVAPPHVREEIKRRLKLAAAVYN